MLLRYLVSTWLNQQGQSVVRNMVSDAISPQQPQDAQEVERPEIVLMFALSIESAGFKEQLQDTTSVKLDRFTMTVGTLEGRSIGVVESGVGKKAAAEATASVLEILAPKWLISTGFAGGLVSELRRGHVVMANSVANKEGVEIPIPLDLTEEQVESSPGLFIGRLLTVDRIIREVDEKKSLGETHQAVAVDMETLAIAQKCQEHPTRLLSVRIISDAVDQPLPKDLEKLVSQKSTAGMMGAAAAAIFNRPGSIGDMWNLNTMANKASDLLAKFLKGTISQL